MDWGIPRQRNKEASLVQKRVLVVDDDEMNLTRARIILQKDYEVLLANSGMEALHILSKEKADLVLLDIEMPKMNGFVTFRRIKETYGEIPVIFLTASGLEDDVLSAIKLGAVNYLKKPFLPQELLRRVALEFENQ
jgi:DNA-binding response OmpR family regulator|nr:MULTISPECIES: response regulator [unclassified Neglectibacter]